LWRRETKNVSRRDIVLSSLKAKNKISLTNRFFLFTISAYAPLLLANNIFKAGPQWIFLK